MFYRFTCIQIFSRQVDLTMCVRVLSLVADTMLFRSEAAPPSDSILASLFRTLKRDKYNILNTHSKTRRKSYRYREYIKHPNQTYNTTQTARTVTLHLEIHYTLQGRRATRNSEHDANSDRRPRRPARESAVPAPAARPGGARRARARAGRGTCADSGRHDAGDALC